jgi:hypothetical protein
MFLLDNDDTQIVLIDDYDNPNEDENGDYTSGLEIDSLNDFFGWDDGIFTLLEVIGVRAEGV